MDSREAGVLHKHSDPVLEKVHQYHEGEQHQAETKLYLSIFALLRLITFMVYLLQGGRLESVMEYLYTNWFEMVKPIDRADSKKQSSGLDGLAIHSDAESGHHDDMPSEEEEVGPSERHIHAL